MSDIIKAGHVRPKPTSVDDSDPEKPAEKKPRLSPSSDNAGVIFAYAQDDKKGSRKQKKKSHRQLLPEPCSSEDVLWRDVVSLLGNEVVEHALKDGSEWDSPLEFKAEVDLVVSVLSSNGEGLAIVPSPHRPWVVVVPLALPGEKLRARVYRNSRLHSFADLVQIITPNLELRDESRIKCKYFGTCSGCQYQVGYTSESYIYMYSSTPLCGCPNEMLSYSVQLDLKRNVVSKAFRNFSGLPEASLPEIQSTIASPLQYSYRTKITPHFDAAPKKVLKAKPINDINEGKKPDWLKIGFNHIGQRHVTDIEECPIATPVLNDAYKLLRADIVRNIYSYKKGASLLLRDSLVTPDAGGSSPDSGPAASSPSERHVCVTNHNTTVRERVGEMLFEYKGGSFFQNNNSVLLPLTNYVRDAIFSPSPFSAPHPTHLVDAYCGCGLFAIALSPHFSTIAGVELSSDSIKFAKHNAQLNNLPEGKCTFHAGDAANIFAAVKGFPANGTVLVIDPPRKGCDDKFIEQVLAFKCRTVVYVSCNVHTQARDVGNILRGMEGQTTRYVVESIQGIDLFPQTAHVESVVLLRLVGEE